MIELSQALLGFILSLVLVFLVFFFLPSFFFFVHLFSRPLRFTRCSVLSPLPLVFCFVSFFVFFLVFFISLVELHATRSPYHLESPGWPIVFFFRLFSGPFFKKKLLSIRECWLFCYLGGVWNRSSVFREGPSSTSVLSLIDS